MLDVVVVIFYNSIQDYYNSKTTYDFIHPKHYKFCHLNASQCVYYPTEYDSDYDNHEDMYKFGETVHNNRSEFIQVIMICVELMVCLISLIQIKHMQIYK